MAQTELGQWIRLRRLQANLNQTQLGSALDVHQVTISSWETGKSEPSPQDLRALEAFFCSSASPGGATNTPQREATAPGPTTNSPTAAPPPKRKTSKAGMRTADFRHEGKKRTNIPTAKIAGEGRIPKVPKARYSYDPHLPPVLRFDETGRADIISDRIDKLIRKAGSVALSSKELSEIREAVRHYQPWLEWAGKREQHEKGWFDVDPVALHIHERVSAQAILRAARREDLQRDLFADPQLPYQEAVQFYRHDVDWTNRIILGDSLQVMSSLARREGLAGRVQMIYIDPPYGIKFGSNFQPETSSKTLRETNDFLTREPEMVRAFRDTWRLGYHSYLGYLRERLILARGLLTDSGSIFVQIGDENLHRVRTLLDEVFGAENFAAMISYRTSVPLTSVGLAGITDHLLWYSKNRALATQKNLFVSRESGDKSRYTNVLLASGERRSITAHEKEHPEQLPASGKVYSDMDLASSGYTESCTYSLLFNAKRHVTSSGKSWKTTESGAKRLALAERLSDSGRTVRYMIFRDDYPVTKVTDLWADTTGETNKKYVVQTHTKIIERCLLMTTEPGDIVLDPTCGGGTTAYVAEQWGRRWIAIDTSRVAIAIARQRLLTAKYDHYATVEEDRMSGYSNPGTGFRYKTVPHITLRSIAQNTHLDPIFEKHQPLLEDALAAANEGLAQVDAALRDRLATKLRDKEKSEGKKAVSDADRRRWLLPPKNRDQSAAAKNEASVDLGAPHWFAWEVPFDTDPDWPEELQQAVTDFREVWREKMREVDTCIDVNAPQEELVDRPQAVTNVVRVSGPFTVDGVMPAEPQPEEEGPFGGAPEELDYPEAFREEAQEVAEARATEIQNAGAYLHRMVQLLRADGVTFPDNRHRSFARIEPLFEDGSGSTIHAEALWEGSKGGEPHNVAIGFGPQYGPVTAVQVEELIHASRRYEELVIAGFSFDADATAIIQEQSHPRLTIHQAHIRPDINPAMDGLLQDPRRTKKRKKPEEESGASVSSQQLFTVFGLPEIEILRANGPSYERVCKLLGVDIYDPITGDVTSTGASKVAAWFLDSDYDGRCFCIAQAFFPNQSAWGKIQRALKTSAEPEAFEAFGGTTSLPFKPGKYRRIAVKVIDPRGNEVMVIRALEG